LGEILAWAGVTFVVGSALVLERRCLGQMAIVQPLVVCLIAGWLSGNETTAVWLGISLQLFSVDRAKEIDWPLAGVVSAAVLLFSKRLDIELYAGGPGALMALMAAVLVGIASRSIELGYAKIDGQYLRANSPWTSGDPVSAVESIVRKVVRRWFIIGGIEVTVGTVLALFAVLSAELSGHKPTQLSSYIAATVLAFSAAVAASSLSKNRFLAWTWISAAISLVVFI
jgi:hypothetical protein